jgi:hypothetical protein
MSASASDNVAVTKVDFSVDGILVGSDTVAPFEAPIDSGKWSDGQHTFKATAFDAAGNTSSSATIATISNADTTPPVVTITSPTDGASVRGTVTVTATGSDNVGIVRYEWFVNKTLYATSTSPSINWTAKRSLTGTTALSVRAWDAAGNSAISPTIKVFVTR